MTTTTRAKLAATSIPARTARALILRGGGRASTLPAGETVWVTDRDAVSRQIRVETDDGRFAWCDWSDLS